MFADRVITFNSSIQYAGQLPEGFQVLNPYLDNPETVEVMKRFYFKYYGDNMKRKLILGINPSRHGAGVTGVPFTDTKRLEAVCGIQMLSTHTHEISSVFMYDMIASYGGPEAFYRDFYINSPFPLAIIRKSSNGNWLNANYYDDQKLFAMVKAFMVDSIKKHISLGLDCNEVIVLGKKNADFITQLNKEHHLFGAITVLEHPRFIQQYKPRERQIYIDKYIRELGRLVAQ